MEKLIVFVFLVSLLLPTYSGLRLWSGPGQLNDDAIGAASSDAVDAAVSEDQVPLESTSESASEKQAMPDQPEAQEPLTETPATSPKTGGEEPKMNEPYRHIGSGDKADIVAEQWPIGGTVKATTTGQGFLSCVINSNEIKVDVEHQPTNGTILLNNQTHSIPPNSNGPSILIIRREENGLVVFFDTYKAKLEHFKRSTYSVASKPVATEGKMDIISFGCGSDPSSEVQYYSTFGENLYSDWSEWSQCDATCGSGSIQRRRDLAAGVSGENAAKYAKMLSESAPCPDVLPACAKDAEATEWSEWSRCTTTCGDGISTRNRSIIPASNGGKTVEELNLKAKEERACTHTPCAVDAAVGEDWTEWSICSVTCGAGTSNRTRKITPPKHGGKTKEELNLKDSEDRSCSETPCPTDAEAADWQQWSECTVTCGGGIITRSRSITPPTFGGRTADEMKLNRTEEKECSKDPCPKDAVGGAWSQWSECSVSCGGGKSTRTRSLTAAANGGRTIKELGLKGSEEKICSKAACPTDAEAGEWQAWSQCSVTCGDGKSTRKRSITPPTMGGRSKEEMHLQDSEEEKCSEIPCPIDAQAAAWTPWSVCTVTCGQGISTRTRSISPAANGGLSKEALNLKDKEEKQCSHDPCAVDATVGDWSEWSACSKTCGKGLKTRTRSEKSAATGGGKTLTQQRFSLVDSKLCENSTPCGCYIDDMNLMSPEELQKNEIHMKMYSVAQCQAKCAGLRSCRAFVYVKTHFKCVLMSSTIESGEKLAMVGYVSGHPNCEDKAEKLKPRLKIYQKETKTISCPIGEKINVVQCRWEASNLFTQESEDKTPICKKNCNGESKCDITPSWEEDGKWGMGEIWAYLPETLHVEYQCVKK